MNEALFNSIDRVVDSLDHLNVALSYLSATHWWNTQWFSAVIGAITGFIGTLVYSSLKDRKKRLADYYQWFLNQGTFSDPQGLSSQAMITSYGNNDKSLGEKMVIELRSHTKYWYEPYGVFRFLLSRYEKSVRKIKNCLRVDLENQEEYIEAEKKFKKVMDFLYRETGENEWTS
jgi:hypothetical protein